MLQRVPLYVCEECLSEFRPTSRTKSNRFCSHYCYRAFGRGPEGTARRFWAKVSKSDGCWIYEAGKGRRGYGLFYLHERTMPAHKVAYELTCGPVPEGLFVCHKCDNPSCVRPDHLFVGTPKDNTQDMIRKGRSKGQSPGENHTAAKLKQSDVIAIRADTRTDTALAAIYGVTQQTISDVRRRRSWRHI